MCPDRWKARFFSRPFLLGVGWSFGLVTGTAIVTNTTPLATRA
ncbi:hypothetical protein [Streptomyces phaeoluteigriseus]